MSLHFDLSTQDIKNIASYINLQDIKKYTANYRDENTEDKNFTNSKALWSFYKDDTICIVNINTNIKGEKNGFKTIENSKTMDKLEI